MTFLAIDTDSDGKVNNLQISFSPTGSSAPFVITIESYFNDRNADPARAGKGSGHIESIVISGSSYIPEAFEGYDQGPEIVLDFAAVVALIA